MSRPDRCRCGRMPGVRGRRQRDGLIATEVVCPGCGATGPEHLDEVHDAVSAVALWNAHGGRRTA